MAYTLLTDCPLRPYNTFGISARAARLVQYDDVSDLSAIFDDPGTTDNGFIHIGHGSNLLFTSDYPGTVLVAATGVFDASVVGNGTVQVRCSAGVTFDDMVARTTAAGLYGAENLSLIPGTVGAAAVQNIGAYGTEVCDIIESVEVYDIDARRHRTLSMSECGYGYRTSVFKEGDMRGRLIVTAVTFRLSRDTGPSLDYNALRPLAGRTGHTPSPGEVRDEVIAIRRAKLPDPAQVGSAGSYFKNPVLTSAEYDALAAAANTLFGPEAIPPRYPADNGMVKTSAAWLIDRCGWKGYRMGHAGVWAQQPLVLTNADGCAAASDILRLERAITDDVFSRLGVRLRPEVEKVGSDTLS